MAKKFLNGIVLPTGSPALGKVWTASDSVGNGNWTTPSGGSAPTNVNIVYVTTTGSDSNDGLSWNTPKLTIPAAITALPTSGGTVKIGGGTFNVSSSSRTDTVSFSSGATFNDASAVSGDVGKYVLWGNLGRIAKIISVVAGVSFTVDVAPLTTTATSARIVAPAIVIPEGVYLEGVGSNFNTQLTTAGAIGNACTQINDAGTGSTIMIRGANSPAGGSTRYGISYLTVNGNTGNKYGLIVGNGAWMIDSRNAEFSNHGIAGIGLDGNINSHNFHNTVLYGNGSATATTATGGVVTHPFNSAGSASCNFYNTFFSANIGFGICDGLDTGGAYGVNLWAPQFNSQQASLMTNSGTSMVLQSKGVGDGMATVVGGWSETAALYDIITSGYVTVTGMRMHSSHAYHWIVNGGIANAVGCTFEGASTATAQLNSSGIFNWNTIKVTSDPVLYSGAPPTIPPFGSSGSIFANALTARSGIIDGNLLVEDLTAATKAYRFRTSGSSLDFDFAGAQMYFSGYPNADFTGTQKVYLIMDTSGNLDACQVWRWHAAPFGATTVTIDSGSSTPLAVAGNISSTGIVTDATVGTSTVAASSAINTTETIVAGPMTIPTAAVGTTYRITLLGTATSTAANVSTFTIRAGTAGTTADASIATGTITAATAGTAVPFQVVLTFTLRSNGTTGAVAGSLVLNNTGVTGIETRHSVVVALTTTSTFNTTTATKLSASYKSAATTTTSTFQNGIIEVVKP